MEKFEKIKLVIPGDEEKTKEEVTTKNFLSLADKVPFDMETAKSAIYKSGLKNPHGYELIKAEALFEAGKIKTKEDLDGVALQALTDEEITAFLNKYDGDKYVKRLFHYGIGHMKRYFEIRKREFKNDQKTKTKSEDSAFDGLNLFDSFDEAFNDGFYGIDFALKMPKIMEHGLTACEYKNRDERFKILERKIKNLPKETSKETTTAVPESKPESKPGFEPELPQRSKGPAEAPREQFVRESVATAQREMTEFIVDKFGRVTAPDGGKVGQLGKLPPNKENSKELPKWDGKVILDKSLKARFPGRESMQIVDDPRAVDDLYEAMGLPRVKEGRIRRGVERLIQSEKYEKSLDQLKVVAEKMFEMEKLMANVLETRKEADEQKNRDYFGDLVYFQPTFDTSSKDAYMKGFMEAVKGDEASMFSFGEYKSSSGLKEDAVDRFVTGYQKIVEPILEKFDHLERSIYIKASGVGNPDGDAKKAAESKYPELKVMGSYRQGVKSGFAKWKLLTQDIFPKKEVPPPVTPEDELPQE